MRIICVAQDGILDTGSGEVSDKLSLEILLRERPGGIIAGVNLYPILCALAPETLKDDGWTMSVHSSRRAKGGRAVKGVTYVSRMSYRFPKYRTGTGKKNKRPPTLKWIILNLELFYDTAETRTLTDVKEAAESLIGVAERRGINPRPSPGALGSTLLRASSEWTKERQPAPFFISEIARAHLPGNFYAKSYNNRGVLSHCYYIDQRSSHHTIAATIPLPHPEKLRARGMLRAVEHERSPVWIDGGDLHYLRKQVGLLCCVVECGMIPREQTHLYPPWAKDKGKHIRWIWTPELRLVRDDPRIQIRHVACGLTSHKVDTAIWEYAEWSLQQNEREDKRYFKSSLLAAYGMLACNTGYPLHLYTVHGRKPSPRSEVTQLPLLPLVYQSTVERIRVPAIQNVVTRGVIEAETRTRSIEYARQLESEGLPVVHIYADGLLVYTDQLPLIIPENWRVVESLSNVYSPHPNTIVSDQLTKMPGQVRVGRQLYTKDGHVSREREPAVL